MKDIHTTTTTKKGNLCTSCERYLRISSVPGAPDLVRASDGWSDAGVLRVLFDTWLARVLVEWSLAGVGLYVSPFQVWCYILLSLCWPQGHGTWFFPAIASNDISKQDQSALWSIAVSGCHPTRSCQGSRLWAWCGKETERCLLDLWWSRWKRAISPLLYWLWPAKLCCGVCCICVGLRPHFSCSGYGSGFAALHREGRSYLVSSSGGRGWHCGYHVDCGI